MSLPATCNSLLGNQDLDQPIRLPYPVSQQQGLWYVWDYDRFGEVIIYMRGSGETINPKNSAAIARLFLSFNLDTCFPPSRSIPISLLSLCSMFPSQIFPLVLFNFHRPRCDCSGSFRFAWWPCARDLWDGLFGWRPSYLGQHEGFDRFHVLDCGWVAFWCIVLVFCCMLYNVHMFIL